MNFLNSPLSDYFLHESSVEKIEIDKTKIVLNFNSGFFNKNHEKLDNCKMILFISKLEQSDVDIFVSVKRKGLFNKEISFFRFLNELNKFKFSIDIEYYSEFERSVILIGNIADKEYELKITDINAISFHYS